ncbi:hypothetical protein CFP59_00033 [Streptomyces malaysiensis subsp. malaysiensis]|nr:hypothetical protein CFP59_00033 [Streptomyces sp. M56]
MTPLAGQLPHTRRGIGITPKEAEELRHGWYAVQEYQIDSVHTCYVLTS